MKLEILGIFFLILTIGTELHAEEMEETQSLCTTYEVLLSELVLVKVSYVGVSDELLEARIAKRFHRIDFTHFDIEVGE